MGTNQCRQKFSSRNVNEDGCEAFVTYRTFAVAHKVRRRSLSYLVTRTHLFSLFMLLLLCFRVLKKVLITLSQQKMSNFGIESS